MISPAPTSSLAPTLARGVFGGMAPATMSRPECLIFKVPDSSYELYLVPRGPVMGGRATVGGRIVGTIAVEARRVDTVHTGGRFVEPLSGRPRRIQGMVIAGGANDASRTLIVNAGAGGAIHCTLTDARQKPSQFPEGTMVSFDVLDGATFTESM